MILTALDLLLAMQSEAMGTYNVLIQMYDDKDCGLARLTMTRDTAKYQHNACKMATVTFEGLQREQQKEPT